jgi:hypothetical protein
VCRVFPHELATRGPARTLALKTAWAHGLHDVGQLASLVDVDRVTFGARILGRYGRAR